MKQNNSWGVAMFEKESKAYAERTKTKKLEVLNKVYAWGQESLDLCGNSPL